MELRKVQLKTTYCWVDLNTESIFSPKFRKLKPVYNCYDGCYYYRIFYNGKSETKNKNTLIKLAKLSTEVINRDEISK